MFSQLVESIIQEINFNAVMRKQASIGRLFPTFRQRVRGVADAGGVTLIEMLPETWHFSVPSSNKTKNNTDYDVYVRFKNLPEMIKKYASDRRLWNQAETSVDLRKLAAEVINSVDIETSCACPATLYWGQDYIRTQRQAQYGDQENRPPNVRNPRQLGSLCKHGALVFEVLPAYTTTFASFLKKFWSEEVASAVETTGEEWAGVQQAAAELGTRREDKPVGFARGGEEIPVGDVPEQPEGETPEAQPGTPEGAEPSKTPGQPGSPATRTATKPGTSTKNTSATKPSTKKGTRGSI